MDSELKAYLEGMRQDLTQQIIESRNHAEQLNRQTRQDLTQQIIEFRNYAEQLNRETRQDLTQQIIESRNYAEQLNRETRQDLTQQMVEMRRDLTAHAEQLNRETRVLLEDLRQQIQLVAEGVRAGNEKMDRLHDEAKAEHRRLDRRIMLLEAPHRSGSDA